MARPRIELQRKLKEIMSENNVYFNPPDGMKLKYPCITYELSGDQAMYADDKMYKRDFRYQVTLMDTNPESIYEAKIAALKFCRLQRPFVQDNVYHWVYEIFH